jgi:thiol:disulfide interchange protein
MPVPTPRATKIVWESDIRRAALRSARAGKPMLLNVSADWCHFCRQMKKETYTQRAVIDQINDQFIAVDLDADADRQLVQLLGITSLPTILVVTPDIKVVSTVSGFQSANALIARLNQVAPRSSRSTEKTDDTVATVSYDADVVVE